MRSRAGVARSGSRGRAGVIVGLVVLVLVAWVQLPGAAAADEPPTYSGAVPLTPPGLGTIFGGYVLGTFRDGRLATGQEDFEGLAADDPFYVEPSISQDVKPGTLLKAKRFDVLFAGVKPAHVAAYKIMYVTENVRGRKVISTGVVMIPEDGKPNGSRSVVAYQEANDSVGAKCHPSTQWSGGALGEASAWSALGPLALMFQRGLAVVISDIGNDADPSPHGVFAGKFAGHALLDGVRAAYRVGPAALNPRNPVGIFGVAGGGSAPASPPRTSPATHPRSISRQRCSRVWRSTRRTSSDSPTVGSAPDSSSPRCSDWRRSTPRWRWTRN